MAIAPALILEMPLNAAKVSGIDSNYLVFGKGGAFGLRPFCGQRGWWENTISACSFQKIIILGPKINKINLNCTFLPKKFAKPHFINIPLHSLSDFLQNFELLHSLGFTEPVARPFEGSRMTYRTEFCKKTRGAG